MEAALSGTVYMGSAHKLLPTSRELHQDGEGAYTPEWSAAHTDRAFGPWQSPFPPIPMGFNSRAG